MKIAINSLSYSKENIVFLKKLFEMLSYYKVEIIIEKKLFDILSKENVLASKTILSFDEESGLNDVNFFFSIGGDGTLLDSITFVREKQIPILGINTGRLGFLATTTKENIEKTLIDIFAGNFNVEERILIRLNSDDNLFGKANFALNDFSILKRDASSMIVVHTYLNGEFLNSYWADGILVSTPTGSTAYSLSCGGPVVFPNSNNFVISPVCPHNLNVRPIVVNADSEISFKIEGRSKNYQVTLDSRSKIVKNTVELSILKENFTAKIITTPEYNYLNTLRTKLSWGSDIRN